MGGCGHWCCLVVTFAVPPHSHHHPRRVGVGGHAFGVGVGSHGSHGCMHMSGWAIYNDLVAVLYEALAGNGKDVPAMARPVAKMKVKRAVNFIVKECVSFQSYFSNKIFVLKSIVGASYFYNRLQWQDVAAQLIKALRIPKTDLEVNTLTARGHHYTCNLKGRQ